MSVTQGAHATAARAANSRPLELLTRAGFIGYGIVHLLFAWLALQIAFGRANEEGDQSGALRTLAAQPLGEALVVAIAVGLTAMALWQLSEALVGHQFEQGRKRLFERVGSAARAVVYAYLAWTAFTVANDASSSSADKQEALSQRLMASTGGRWLVALVGLGLVALGVGLVVYGVTRRFLKRLEQGRMSPRTHALSQRLGVAGYAAKGLAYGIAGVLVVTAAVTYDPDKARGLDAALRTLREQSYGPLLLVVIALGFAAYAAYCAVQAKFRKV
jgi:hypothetical protein